ncbi:MAG: hypothetical protein JXB62_11760 [Pirellulales bacterium]|nr:hypothetical protein [Pirellulales bacterium]
MKRRLIATVGLVILLIGCRLFSSSNHSTAAPPASADADGPDAADEGGDFRLPLSDDGWFDLHSLLVASDGSRSLGNHRARFNDSRDHGSKIVFFDPVAGDNDTADVYWWDGRRIVDSAGRPANPENGEAYGIDPLLPNEKAVRPFRHGVGMVRNADADPRLRTNDRDCSAVAGGYPDWFLYRRGRTHDTFDSPLVGGRSAREPMVIVAYGPREDGRAVMDPAEGKRVSFQGKQRSVCNPMSAGTRGAETVWIHLVLSGLDVRAPWSALGAHEANSYSGGPVTAYAEDCRWAYGEGGRLAYLPRGTTIRRSVVAFSSRANAHNQGYFASGFRCSTTFDEVIFYRNGYKSNPRTDPDPRRDIFSRNVYQGGGAMLGHRYLGIISADGGSGGPQMRLGGQIERSLIVEGYWYNSTNSNKLVNPWLISREQSGQSALVRNNVQLVFAFPTPRDPDTAARKSSPAAQPAWGYSLASASFGALVEGNIISQAMLIDELGVDEGSRGHGIGLSTTPETYEDGRGYSQQNNTIRGNIVYRTGTGLQIQGDWSDARGIVVENNVLVANSAVQNRAEGIAGPEVLSLRNNRFYAHGGLPGKESFASGNKTAEYASAAAAEGWPDPNRTLKRYVTEVLGLTLLDWADAPWLDPAVREARIQAGESYDPMGMKTFMAVATNMRRGGEAVPGKGKPSWTGDYRWDTRLTGPAVVNWIRAGFGLPAVE